MSNLIVAAEQPQKLSAYEVRHLVEHLAQIEGQQELRRLMSIETDGGRNHWYELKLKQGVIDSYFDDLQIASEVEGRAITGSAHNAGTHLSSVVLYAGMRSSLVQRASNVPAALLHELAVRGIWSPEQCFRYALSQPTPERRGNALCSIFPILSPAARQASFEHIIESVRQLDRIAGNDGALRNLQQAALRQFCDVLVRENELPLLLKICEMQAGWIANESTAWMLAEYLGNVRTNDLERCVKAARHLIQATPMGIIMVAPAVYGLLSNVERRQIWTSLRLEIGQDPFIVHHLITACKALARWEPSAEIKELVDPLYAQILTESIDSVRITHLVNLLPLLQEQASAAQSDAVAFIAEAAANDLTLEDIVSALGEHSPTSWNEIRTAVRSIPSAFMRWKVMATAAGAFPDAEAQYELALGLDYIVRLSKTDAFSAEVLLESMARLAPKMTGSLIERFEDLVLTKCTGVTKIRALSSLSGYLSPGELRTCTEKILETPVDSLATSREAEVARFFERAAPSMNETLLRDSLHRLEARSGTISPKAMSAKC